MSGEHTHPETDALSAGLTTHVELKCIGGLESALVSTRYTKKAIVR